MISVYAISTYMISVYAISASIRLVSLYVGCADFHIQHHFSFIKCFLIYAVGNSPVSTGTDEDDVLKALSQIIDPDFGTDIVTCGFVKDLQIDKALGEVLKSHASNFWQHV
jgi:hypothetical protein